jgi:ssDNA-binding Zn-finger/Zn-ribbon topoisomerase 1
MDKELMIKEDREIVTTYNSIEQIQMQMANIKKLVSSVLVEGEHYGKIPGCGETRVLLKSGAEKLSLMFKLYPKFEIEIIPFENNHREYRISCSIFNQVTNQMVGQGLGSASTLESKYRYRNAERACPECGKNSLIKDKDFNTGAIKGWFCFPKKGGCGAKFGINNVDILGQEVGKIENTDIADTYNTVLKIAKKRALVDAILTATSASDIFTQDLEETMILEKEEINKPTLACVDCGLVINEAEFNFSKNKFGKPLCRNCQKNNTSKQTIKNATKTDSKKDDFNIENINDEINSLDFMRGE